MLRQRMVNKAMASTMYNQHTLLYRCLLYRMLFPCECPIHRDMKAFQ